MIDECLSIEMLGEIEHGDGEAAARKHLQRCPRCRARLSAYLRFMEREETRGSAPLAPVVDRLRTRLEAEMDRHQPVARGGEGMSRFTLLRPLHALGIAACLLIVAGALWIDHQRKQLAPEIILRGDPAGASVLDLQPPQRTAAGDLRLSWSPLPEADGYRVLLFDVNLAEIARFEAGRDCRLQIGARNLAAALAGRAPQLWRVEALAGGDVIARSRPDPL